MKTLTTRSLGFTLVLLLVSFALHSATYKTKQYGDWTSPGSWENQNYPGTSILLNDTVIIKHAINLDGNIKVYGALIIGCSYSNNANLSGSKNLTIESEGLLIVYSYLTLKDLNVQGSFDNSGAIKIENNLITIAGSNTISSGTLYVFGMLENHGGFTNSGTITNVDDLVNYGTFINTGSINVTTELYNHKLGGTFTNNGLINVEGEMRNSGDFVNNDLLDVYGKFNNDADGSFLNNDTTIVNASSLVSINNGTLAIDTNGVFIIKGMFTNIVDGISTAEILNYGELVLICDTNNCATFIDEGTVTMMNENSISIAELFLSGGQWHYISIPMTTASSNVFWGGAIYSYDEEKGNWKKHTNNENLDVTIGYDVYFKNDKTLRFEGTLRKEEQTSLLSYVGGSTSKGFNLIANPYYACVDWNKKGWSKKNAENGIYIWDPKSQNVSAYVNGVGINGGTQYIPPFQGFFVKCDSTIGSVKVEKTVKVHHNETLFRQEEVSDELLRIKVIAENGYSDETVIRFTNNATAKFDPDFDADKMLGYNLSIPQLYTKSVDGTDLSINSIPEIKEQISIPLYCKTRISSKSSIEINLENMGANVNVFVEDLKTENIHDMATGVYEFNADVNDDESRFVIHFTKPGTIASGTTDIETESSEDEGGINIYTDKGSVIVDLQTNSNIQSSISVFSLNGTEMFYTQTTDSYNEVKLDLTTGYYIVKVENTENSYSRKVIIW